MLKEREVYTVTVEESNLFGNGVCKIDGIAVFVFGGVMGDECRVEITKVFPKYAYASVIELLTPSPHRTEPLCGCFPTCGGCSFLNATIELENTVKENYVKNAFVKQDLAAEVEKIVCPVCEKYRNKVVLFYNKESFGYMEKSSNKIVPHSSCLLNEDVFDKIAAFVANGLVNTPLRALYMRKAQGEKGEIMVCPIFYEKTDAFSFITKLLAEFPTITTVLTGVLKDRDFALEKVRFSTVYGDGYIHDTLCSLRFRVSPESFYQVNHRCAELLYEKALEYADLDKNTVCADLFCGTGTIGIIAAYKTGAKVYGVEIVEKAIEDAKHNARLNNVNSISLKAMDAGEFDKEVDVCIIDPPRKGCSQLMINTLKRLKPKSVVYVSCNVDTMTRDIKLLSREYKISSPVSIFNLFPRTSHVESVVCLTKK